MVCAVVIGFVAVGSVAIVLGLVIFGSLLLDPEPIVIIVILESLAFEKCIRTTFKHLCIVDSRSHKLSQNIWLNTSYTKTS